jgi:prepilin-type N-terminal cleavage/methylation domain-containing protein
VASERGFTLIEVLVTMAVLAFGILGVLQATLVAARLEERSGALATGTLLAQESLERIGALGWERVTAGLATGPLPAQLGVGGEWLQQEVARSGGRYLLVFEREAGTAAPRCTVHCYWRGVRGSYDPGQAVHLWVRRRP